MPIVCHFTLAWFARVWRHGFRVDLVDLLESVSSVVRIF
jgi:hypothetical protein